MDKKILFSKKYLISLWERTILAKTINFTWTISSLKSTLSERKTQKYPTKWANFNYQKIIDKQYKEFFRVKAQIQRPWRNSQQNNHLAITLLTRSFKTWKRQLLQFQTYKPTFLCTKEFCTIFHQMWNIFHMAEYSTSFLTIVIHGTGKRTK